MDWQDARSLIPQEENSVSSKWMSLNRHAPFSDLDSTYSNSLSV